MPFTAVSIYGGLQCCQATVKIITKTGGNVTPLPFPTNGTIRTQSLTVTAAGGNAGTIYIAFDSLTGMSGFSSISTATRREQTMIKLTPAQSFTFTGLPVAGSAYRDLIFGSNRSYIHASATPNRAICTYYNHS